MDTLYELVVSDNKKFPHSLRVYDSYIEIKKTAQTGQLFSIFHPETLTFLERIDLLEKVEYIPNYTLGVGVIRFYKKGAPVEKMTKLNYMNLPEVFYFNTKRFEEKAREIYEYVNGRVGTGA